MMAPHRAAPDTVKGLFRNYIYPGWMGRVCTVCVVCCVRVGEVTGTNGVGQLAISDRRWWMVLFGQYTVSELYLSWYTRESPPNILVWLLLCHNVCLGTKSSCWAWSTQLLYWCINHNPSVALQPAVVCIVSEYKLLHCINSLLMLAWHTIITPTSHHQGWILLGCWWQSSSVKLLFCQSDKNCNNDRGVRAKC